MLYRAVGVILYTTAPSMAYLTDIYGLRDRRREEMGFIHGHRGWRGEPRTPDMTAPPPDPHWRPVSKFVADSHRPAPREARTLAEALGLWRQIGGWWNYSRAELAEMCPETRSFILGLRAYDGNASTRSSIPSPPRSELVA